jgi:hypothetical protein
MTEKTSPAPRLNLGDDLLEARALFPDLVDEAKERAVPPKRLRTSSLIEAIREPAPVFRVTRISHG